LNNLPRVILQYK